MNRPIEYTLDGTQTVKFDVKCDLATLSRIECVYWRKTDEEWPTPSTDFETRSNLVGVLFVADASGSVCGAFDVLAQKFYCHGRQVEGVKYWSYLPKGPEC
jgi:hypothetical protein